MIKECRHLMELKHTQMEQNAFKVCESEMLNNFKDLFFENYNEILI